jgi:phospholipase/carboxylesterase
LRFALALLAASLAAVSVPASAAVRQITPKAIAYVPEAVTTPAPVIVLLHGAGGNARSFAEDFRQDVEARGAILLSIQSAAQTWALRKPTAKEPDVVNIRAAIDGLEANTPVDRKRIAIMGFSDGASYALSVGLAYPDVFSSIVAFSPGYALAPRRLETDQRIFIAHGRRDRMLPADNARQIVKGLEAAGFSPEVHWFNGGHEIDPHLKQAGIDFALKP